MRAAVADRYGPPEVVRVADVDPPTAASGELRIRVCATTVNRTDCGYRAAKPFFIRPWSGLRRPRSPILGTEFAGTVEAVGANVTSFAVGDRVFGYCEGVFGAHADVMTIDADAAVAPIPPGLSFAAAAPATEGWHYAMANIRAAEVHRDQDVLVHGATGAIGSAAVQILHSLGARVTAVCSGAHVELVAGLGADRVIDRDTEEFTDDAGTYDVVFDAVGKSTFGRCRRLLRPGGVFLTTDLGPWAQNPLLTVATRLLRATPLFGHKRVLIGFPDDDPAMAEQVREMMEAGEFRPVIDRTYPLEEIVEAYRFVESGQKIGNVVIAVSNCDEAS